MQAAAPSVLAVIGDAPPILVGSGQLSPALSFVRASPALALGADGATWSAVAAGAPRIHGTTRRILLEGARTNLVTNPRFEGAATGVVGSGGALPTGYAVTGTGAAAEVVSLGSATGLPALTLRLSAAAAPSTIILTIPVSGMLAAGDPLTCSFFGQVVAGSLANVTGVTIASSGVAAVSLSAAMARTSTTRTYAGGGAAGYAIRFACTAGAAVNLTVTLLAPQAEVGAFPSSPILPAAGAPTVTTRAASVASLALAGARAERGTLLLRAMLPQAAPAGLDQGLLTLDAGSDANRIVLRNAAGGGTVGAALVSGGTTLATLAGGTVAAGTPFRAALAWSPAGVALCLSGGAVQSTATAPPAVSRLLIGHAAAALDRAMHGEVERLDLRAERLPDATLHAFANP